MLAGKESSAALGAPVSGVRCSRRTFLRAGSGGLFGMSLERLWAAEAAATAAESSSRRARSVIFLFLFGGPSQLETFDMKPQAPSEVRGPFRPIPCRTPGLSICEHLPRLANLSDKFCVVRSVSHDYNDHSGAAHYVQTGRKWQVPIGGGFVATPQDWPSIGSVVEYQETAQSSLSSASSPSDLPKYVVLPNHLGRLQESGQYRRPGEYAGWLGHAYNPLTTRVNKRDLNDNPYWRTCTDEELTFQIAGMDPLGDLTLERLQDRATLLAQFDEHRRILDERAGRENDQLRQRAFGLLTSAKTRNALDLRQEPASVRDRYGRHLFGQSTLLARRLVEAGVRFVTVHYDACDGYGWDSHVHSRDVQHRLLPTLDQALGALLSDLSDRGMLAETLVVAMGEMGRTPKPTPEWGRGHWSTAFPAVLAGGGIHGGTVWGSTDRQAAFPTENRVAPEDLAATLYWALGIDPHTVLHMPDGRPTPLVDGGVPLHALLS